MNIACVLLQELPLQMVLRERPGWRGAPVAIIDGEGPHAHINYCNQLAARAGIRVGMQQAAARNLVPALHTRMVLPEETDRAVHDLIRSLQTFSPRVEVDRHFRPARRTFQA